MCTTKCHRSVHIHCTNVRFLILIRNYSYVRCKYWGKLWEEYTESLCNIVESSFNYIMIPKLKKLKNTCRTNIESQKLEETVDCNKAKGDNYWHSSNSLLFMCLESVWEKNILSFLYSTELFLFLHVYDGCRLVFPVLELHMNWLR